ncbi:exodeoxyribonuclease V subunit beta [Spiribacter vilamensis]|uniref:RecBCD enzyme subunit RecB n=1 Tax=Spiribacter vilamensis TaxID=531306 RepID=A0A4Q8CZ71_9GAMM|nr:exodeoxyribonuclease V subunit beta [Spiribacter vilamensis]RZU98264.1 DNA helicase/exodeoxyribonuclease V beta subunit [Spiribacter vilamensis]TVO60841.1 exodeoxyribonuclease V subunit beta [Spiribacter vilamensis]
MTDPQPLDVLAAPLEGHHLIEASAGTGKTFTLTAIYLRLVLGHDPADPERRPMLPPEILVMTFTRDATRELRDRIRARLATAARCFAGAADPDPDDGILGALLAAYPDPDIRQRHADHLRAAADWMDEAAIYTIHSFCHRMLQQHAFEAGNAFALELSEDTDLITREAIEDYWRETVYPLDAAQLDALGFMLSGKSEDPRPSVERFAANLQPLLSRCDSLPSPADDDPMASIRPGAERAARAVDALRRAVASDLEGFDQALGDARTSGCLPGNRKPTTKTWASTLKPALAEWVANPAQPRPGIDVGQVSLSTLRNGTPRGRTLPEALAEHPIATAADELQAAQTALAGAAGPFYAHAVRWVARRVEATQHQRGVLGYSDMLTRLRDALDQPDAGARLAATIRQQFPVALVDEFQDTDPVQYRILQAIYPADAPASLILIGDPKQAIYGFRGADLATYLSAAAHVPVGQRYTLDRNYRSSTGMVEAVNTLFGESPLTPGPFHPDAIDFAPVAANGRSETLWIGDQPASAMTLWQLEQEDTPDESLPLPVYRQQMAEVGAEQIRQLLDRAAEGDARFENGGAPRAVQPADIAILVRSGQEAGLIRAALRRRGLASVYLSDRDNVLKTPEASDVLRWLQAMATPESERRVRTALGTASMGYDWATLDGLFSDDARWEAALEQFQDYGERWQRQGVLPALRQLIHDHSLASRLAMQDSGERTLTNLLQISELLQEAAATLDGSGGLIRWLDEAMQHRGESPADDRILRLESDAALIKVVTIHKSKGLEYPLVFLPFVCSYRSARAEPPFVRTGDDGPEIAFEAGPDDTAAAQDRQQAEDMRLLYVAITRAVHACWLGLAPVRESAKTRPGTVHLQRSAIGRLLGWPDAATPMDLGPCLEALARRSQSVTRERIQPASVPAAAATSAVAPLPAMAIARHYTSPAPGQARWWIASYSALVEDGPRAAIPGTAQADILAEESRDAPLAPAAPPDSRTDALAAIPAGPATGTVIHSQLEALASRQFPGADDPAFSAIVDRGLRGQRWRPWVPAIRDWLAAVTDSDLPLPGAAPVRLSTLDAEAFVAELEFLVAIGRVRASRIDAIIQRHTLGGVGRPALGENELNGMIKGYIDLIFCHEGRYWVMDYKSNRLPPSADARPSEALEQIVREKRYDAQYALYLLALHRLLRARLGDAYDYDIHVGGAVCFFLRGISQSGRGIHAERPDRALVESLDALFNEEPEHV